MATDFLRGVTRLGEDAGQSWSFARNVAVLGGGTAIAQSFNVLLAPVLTRLYQPESLGQFELFTSFLNVAVLGICLRYELGIVAVNTERKAAHLAFASLVLCVPFSVVAAGVLYACIHFAILGFNTLPLYAAGLMAPALVLSAAFFTLRYWFVREERFGYVSQATVVQNGVRSIFQLIIGLLGARFGGLLIGELMGRSAGMSRMFRQAWPKIRKQVFPLNRQDFSGALREARQFPMYSLPSSLVDSLAANVCIPMIIRYYGADAGGYYALVQRVLALPILLVSANVADAFHGRIASYARSAPDKVRQLFWRTSAVLVLLAIIPTLILTLYGERAFRLAFGANWAFAGKLATVVAPLFLAQFVVVPLSRVVFVLEGQKLKLIYDALALTGRISVFLFSAWRHLSLVHAIMIFSAMGTLTYAVYYLLLMRIIFKHRQQRLAPTPDVGQRS
jgi:O-antigen/teichoic acid export membrane protein